MMVPYPAEVVERFWSKVNRGADTECWPWAAAMARGYGVVRLGRGGERRLVRANRMAVEIDRMAQIPSGLCALHTCGNSRCVNPKHLYVGTRSDNTRDQLYDGTHAEARKAVCRNGHQFDGVRGKQRICRTCIRAASRRSYLKAKGNRA